MRIAKIIFLVLGILLILFTLLGYLGGADPFKEDGKMINRIAYFVGVNLFAITGLLFLFVSYLLSRRIASRNQRKFLDSFLAPEKTTFDDR
ncbi:MAG: hypothetical protein H7Y42_07890 [Chitinophagaceae bacterium]|nr:hypothetical protein [Chitinophagaceae bacterium]